MADNERLARARKHVKEYLDAVEEYERCKTLAESALVNRFMIFHYLDDYERRLLNRMTGQKVKVSV